MFIIIEIAIDNIIGDTRKYKLIILYIEQMIINLNVFIKRIISYQLI